MRITYEMIQNNPDINTYITQADASLIAMGFTEHSFAHVTKCANVASRLLRDLGYSEREQELAKIAGYMHDIGNVDKLGMDASDIAAVVTAIGNHDEHTAFPVNAISAALILADKTDVRRSRVRNRDTINFDIHDRVNYAVERSDVTLDRDRGTITLALTINTQVCAVMDYFEIFLTRMLLCRKAAEFFHLSFKLDINGVNVL